MVNDKVKIDMVKSDSFKQVYVVGALGGHTTYDFRMAFYNDSVKRSNEGENSVERKIEAEVILSPTAAKELAAWLTNHVLEYEKTFGVIKLPKDAINQSKKPEVIGNEKQKSETVSYIG